VFRRVALQNGKQLRAIGTARERREREGVRARARARAREREILCTIFEAGGHGAPKCRCLNAQAAGHMTNTCRICQDIFACLHCKASHGRAFPLPALNSSRFPHRHITHATRTQPTKRAARSQYRTSRKSRLSTRPTPPPPTPTTQMSQPRRRRFLWRRKGACVLKSSSPQRCRQK
jgi:hypothetical protein